MKQEKKETQKKNRNNITVGVEKSPQPKRIKMIYCEKIKKDVDQEVTCDTCIFYKKNKDTCTYPKWKPGLKKGRKW